MQKKGLLQNSCFAQACHCEPVRTLAWQSVSSAKGADSHEKRPPTGRPFFSE